MAIGFFQLGQTAATTGVMSILNEVEIYKLLNRHVIGDWGDLCGEDKKLNDLALSSGEGRLFSSYKTSKGKIWIITEADRSLGTGKKSRTRVLNLCDDSAHKFSAAFRRAKSAETTVLLPEEY